MLEAIQAKSASVATLGLVNHDTPRAILTLFLTDLITFLNLGMSMSVNQVQMTVEMIMRDTLTKNLKPEDFKVAFDQFKKGGKSWNRIDGQTIFEIIYKYAQEKADFVETLSINQHSGAVSKTPMIAPEVVAMYKEIIRLRQEGKITRPEEVPVRVEILDPEESKKLKAKYGVQWGKPEEVEKKPKKVIEKTARDLFIQKCFNEFDAIHLKYPVEVKSGRYIFYEGQNVDQVEYATIRLKTFDAE